MDWHEAERPLLLSIYVKELIKKVLKIHISKQTLKYLNQIQETYAKIFQTSLLSNG